MNEGIDVMHKRQFSPLDQLLISADQALKTVFGQPLSTGRDNPSDKVDNGELSEADKQKVVRLMRINHTGEVCAQALYQGQALTASSVKVKEAMQRSADEENDHLGWCDERIKSLGGRKSLLNPIWYSGSFAMGVLAGAVGDKWSLGFVAETEHQVEKHLTEHLQQLPSDDEKSRAILEQMREDEIHHAQVAKKAGAADLPWVVQASMQLTSKVMTKTVYWL